ncbi:hypothetical protein CS0771_02260 [Catellatospora sp. IY07-71]|uniref:hypothetical protein n=1 Tax=Catellatospora sp. IY07-71 TaxID=2728827 RepID=UPI001BB2F59B|nr:hypothetical protein [Catellatospora sp. IY07-71]BCJ70682.1 hypothetical protein CS0771_02260 [Catellatospora sp. IY07-71]
MIKELGADSSVLAGYGLSPEEYNGALSAAIENIRGSMSASNADRRDFLVRIFGSMKSSGVVEDVIMPQYGDDTVYRLRVRDVGDVAVIQKGCPDGAHSSLNWSVPSWAAETYLWWICSSMNYHPGVHIAKGVGRLKKKFLSEAAPMVDGVVFYNELCGSARRPCPRSAGPLARSAELGPPPCVYVMPDAERWNWENERVLQFPRLLLQHFGVRDEDVESHVGNVGFRRGSSAVDVKITARFGPGRSTVHRS